LNADKIVLYHSEESAGLQAAADELLEFKLESLGGTPITLSTTPALKTEHAHQ
jgi:hypothetical protein